ncbi:uncharacterized protein [Drosophila tropicalis]|uniref:uncharacterized protein n=1 Tax=Drosophila tropicalis TaxID=46794 RepID=UPI0035ABF325
MRSKKDFMNATNLDIMRAFPQHILSCQFIPPSAPHVKSFKTLFYKSSSTVKYTFEELSTLLCRIEACLNSRPISPMSEDPEDLLALSPGHFLIGGPLLSIAEPEILVEPMSLINRWQRLKAIQQAFCRRWKSEYLKEWKSPTRSLQTGDLVIVFEDNLPSNEWRLGRIERTLPGSDGLVRVADVSTARGSIRRPVAKLILLQDSRSPEPKTLS